MSSKISFTGYGFAFAATAVAILGVSAIVASTLSRAQTAPTAAAEPTAAIQHDSDEARKMKEPSFQTREERLSAKPLDWNVTTGTPKRRVLTEDERKLLERAQPESAEEGKPDARAEIEARRLHPEDWK
jgi:hypothetical protein